ncbi:unnamed protein product [Soboliphyme baturini]|uniref:Secreted protein n=1 Tax=Soboliphyme baturini TaxID=241478 RepID=A0A183IV72_9BILA|nr:unnamed protein product [Soboliphyme baturini]
MCRSKGFTRCFAGALLSLVFVQQVQMPFVRQKGKWVKEQGDRRAMQSKFYSKRFREWWQESTADYDKSIRPNFGGRRVSIVMLKSICMPLYTVHRASGFVKRSLPYCKISLDSVA